MWGDVLFVVSQGFGKLSLVAALAAQSAGSVVQAGTKEFTTKVFFYPFLNLLDARRLLCYCQAFIFGY
ncbi:hypothetical protein FF1_020340 [Malus domestica]